MSQTVLGIDIGSYSIKVSELTRSLRDFELINYFEKSINQSSRLTYEEAVTAALRGILESNEVSFDMVSVSLPANILSTRVIELPFTNIKKIEHTIEFELESFIPLSLDELLVDYHILSIENERSTVLCAYVPRNRFIRFLDMLEMAGIDPKYVGVDCIDLSHIAQVAMVPQNAVYALIDIGHKKTNICVMEGMRLQYVRTITIGGSHFTRAIQKTFRLNFEKAEALKLDRGRVSFKEGGLDQISRLCQEVSHELIVSIRQTYLGYKQIYPHKEWLGIYLCGGGAKLPGLAETIAAAVRINVSSLDCLEFINHRLDQPEMAKEVIPLSLAQTLRVIFSNKAININFRRGEFGFKRDIKALGSEMKLLSFWFLFIILLGGAHFGFSYYSLNSRIEKANSNLIKSAIKALPELKSQKTDSSKKLLSIIDSKIAELKPQLEAIQRDSSELTPLGILLEISSQMPSKEELQIDVDDFSITGDNVRIDGRAISFESVDIVKEALSKSPHFKNVTTRNVVKGIRDEIKFSLSLDIVGKDQES